MTSAEWAAWVQAVGSIAAIFGAAAVANWQFNKQRRSTRADVAEAVAVLATNAAKAMRHVADQLKDRQSIYNVGEGLVPCDLGEITRVDGYVNAIPLHLLPKSLVSLTMILGSTVRQFKEKVEMTLRLHRKMNGDEFEDFFETVARMNEGIALTGGDIAEEVELLKNE